MRKVNRKIENKHFNPRTPCGVRHVDVPIEQLEYRISIHAPRVGCDSYPDRCIDIRQRISIHAPRVGCDTSTSKSL